MPRWVRWFALCLMTTFNVGCLGFCDNDPTELVGPTGVPSPTPNKPSTTDLYLLAEHGKATPDPKFPGLAACPNAFAVHFSGQIRNAAEPQLAPDDSLSGGTGYIRSCGWKIATGWNNGQPRYPGTDTTVWTAVPTAGDNIDYIPVGESFKKVQFRLIMSDQKVRLNNLQASLEGNDWHVKGKLSTLGTFSTASSAEALAELKRLAISGEIPAVVYYEEEATGKVYERNFLNDTIVAR